MGPLLTNRAHRVIPVGLLMLTVSCGDGVSPGPTPFGQGKTIYAVDLSNNFELFHSASPGIVDRKVAITGLPVDQRIVGIDFRPADGKLYGVGTDSRVYLLDTVTAVATPVGSSFTPPLEGDHFGVTLQADDAIRIQSAESGQNFRLAPTTGQAVATDPVLVYASGDLNEAAKPAIAATAVNPAAGTTTYGIDWLLNELVLMDDPSNGQVTTIGPTGVSTAPCVALDMGDDGVLYATMTVNGTNQLYTMNVITGAAMSLGEINVGASIQSIAVAPGGASDIVGVERGGQLPLGAAVMGGSAKSCRTDQ